VLVGSQKGYLSRTNPLHLPTKVHYRNIAFSALTLSSEEHPEIEWRGAHVVICLEQSANELYNMVQLVLLPPIIFCFSKIQNGMDYHSGAGLPNLSWKRSHWVLVFTFVVSRVVMLCRVILPSSFGIQCRNEFICTKLEHIDLNYSNILLLNVNKCSHN